MKLYAPILLLLLGTAAQANTAGDFVGISKTGFKFTLYMDSANSFGSTGYELWENPTIGISQPNKRERHTESNCVVKRSTGEFQFRIMECVAPSPLGSAHYEGRMRKKRNGEAVQYLECRKGCNNSIPVTFRYFESLD